MTGFETGTRMTQAGAGFWLYNATQGSEATNAPKVIENVVDTLTTKWNANVVRIPICGSAWTQDYVVRDWGKIEIGTYRNWVDVAVKRARAKGAVVIIDLHLWAIAKQSSMGGPSRGTFTTNGKEYKYSDYVDGCTGSNKVGTTDSCAPKDWFTEDANTWQCAIANADGATIHSAYKNKAEISAMWSNVAGRYKADSGIWYELFNEPYAKTASGDEVRDANYPWDLWTDVMHTWIKAIRDSAKAKNIIIVNGMDWGYDFGPEYGPIANPDKYLPWKSTYANIAYAWHPYQHGTCCGAVGTTADESVKDPYQAGYCAYYKDGSTWGSPSGAPLPAGKACDYKGYAATQDKKMPPCHWVDAAYNPKTKTNGLCAGDRAACSAMSRSECSALNWSSAKAGGWSRYVLPMSKYGPLIATEFGSFDCSSPYVTTLLKYMAQHDVSYTVWALWPQNSGGPGGGACGYPSIMKSTPGIGDFRSCLDPNACRDMVSPLPWAGDAIFSNMGGR
jgi:hypothetical protein